MILVKPAVALALLLVAVIERRVGAAPVGDEFVDAGGGVDQPAARESEVLIVAGYVEERREIRSGVANLAEAVFLP